jgi:hypothetical protein
VSDELSPALTQAIAEANFKVLGEAPTHSVALVYQVLGQSIAQSLEVAQVSQSGMMQLGSAITAAAVNSIMQLIKSD